MFGGLGFPNGFKLQPAIAIRDVYGLEEINGREHATMSDIRGIVDVEVSALSLDLDNPRFAGSALATTEPEMIKFLYEEADLEELLLSFLNSGYLEFEPIVVRRADNKVLEGNRRVAALKLIADTTLRAELGIELPKIDQPKLMPKAIGAILVNDAKEARSYIGFKHINGPKAWDALSKAKYAADWHNEGVTLPEIARSLGDTFNTVSRLVHGYKILEQAKLNGFDPAKRTARRLAFSHLYTAITRSSIREWLEIDETKEAGLVPKSAVSKLSQLMSWLYGQSTEEPAIIKTQNPDLNKLADVIAHEGAREVLIASRDLNAAWEETEAQSQRLEKSLIQAVRHTESAAALQGSFDVSQKIAFDYGQRLARSAQALFRHFRDVVSKAEGLDEDL